MVARNPWSGFAGQHTVLTFGSFATPYGRVVRIPAGLKHTEKALHKGELFLFYSFLYSV